jgi:hypothetical protein
MRLTLFVLLLSLFSFPPQNQKELTRPVALLTINVSDKMPTTERVYVTDEAFELAKKDGIIDRNLQLTAKGKESFRSYWFFAHQAVVKVPLKTKALEITGITDAPPNIGGKIATFQWVFVGASEIVNTSTGSTGVKHDGKAILKLYDDGWRVEQLEM